MSKDNLEEKAEGLTTTEETQPSLSSEFYEKILGQPSCITKGVCDNCDRCGY